MFFRRGNNSSAAPASGPVRLIVGLGNPGRQYEQTRHNIGYEVVDELALRHGARWRAGKHRADEAHFTLAGTRVLLLKPTTFMNLSGDAVVSAKRFYKAAPQDILVICDDIHLPLGRLRLRAGGSDGGHNGLWSLIQRLGTKDFPRLRIGVGEPPPEWDMADYVLQKVPSAEWAILRQARNEATDAVERWLREGTAPAMNRVNASPPRPKKPPADDDAPADEG